MLGVDAVAPNPSMMVLLLISASLVTVYLAFFAWRRRRSTGAGTFALLMACVTLWSVGSAIEFGGVNYATKLIGVKLEYIGVVAVPLTWLVFVLSFTGRGRWVNWHSLILLGIEPAVILSLVLTRTGRQWFWGSLHLDAKTSTLVGTHTAIFWLNAVYSYALLLLGFSLLLFSIIRFYRIYRGQAIALMIGGLLPWIGNAVFIFGGSPIPNIDLTPFCFTFTGIFVGWALFRLRLLEIVPVARDAIIDSMSDPVIVLDRDNRIVDLNPSALRILGYSSSEVLGLTAREALSDWSDLVERFRDSIEGADEIVLADQSGNSHIYDLRISPVKNRRGLVTGRFITLRDITEQKHVDKLQRSLGTLRSVMEELVQAIALIVEMRDPYTAGHERRVAQLACALASEMGLSDEKVAQIKMASIIHDIGKIYIPAEILNKPGRLTDIEFQMIKTHAEVGYDVLKTINFNWDLARIVRQHHERLDGTGYPDGLVGDAILLEARIIAVADVVEAMSSHRPYRPALGIDIALNEIKEKSGVLYDAEVVAACVRLFETGFDFE